jgi:hypothetical protein
MPVKQKYTTMRPLLYTSIVLLFLSSCITSSHVHYSDPNYLASSEFSSYEEIVTEPVSEIEIYQTQDTDTITDNYYSEYDVADDYYDYSFSSRIRRFHRPMYYSNYYGGLYTDYYWYNNDPFYCGTSIYYGYNWNSPYYSYYSPYYSNNYNSYYAYGHNNYHHNTPTYTYYNNNNNHTTGHRGSLSSHSSGRGVKTNTIIPNTNVNTSTLNIRNGNTLKNNTNSTIRNTSITTKPYRGNTTIKTGNSRGNTSTKTNNSYRGNTSNKTTTKKGNHSYTTPKSNTNKKSYSAPKSNSSKRNYNSGSSKSNRGSKSSRNSNRRSTKPRK